MIPLKAAIYARDSHSEYLSRERKCLVTSLIGTNRIHDNYVTAKNNLEKILKLDNAVHSHALSMNSDLIMMAKISNKLTKPKEK